jgi:hypothetical protein
MRTAALAITHGLRLEASPSSQLVEAYPVFAPRDHDCASACEIVEGSPVSNAR